MNRQRKEYKLREVRGFTSLELLITVAIAAILLIIGVPTFQDFGLRQRMSAAVRTLHDHLALARNQAIRFNTEIVLCPGALEAGCNGTTNWSSGWIVFSDLNGDRQYQPLESVHRIEDPLDQIMVQGSSGRTSLRFFPNGSAPGSNSSITFCDRRGPAHARKLVISNTGRIRRDVAPGLDDRLCPQGG